jgi:hypothetical protein
VTTCASCGGVIKPQSKFCSQCGAKVGDSAIAIGRGSAAIAAKRFQVSTNARSAISGTLFVAPSHFVSALTQLLDQHAASPLAIVADADPVQLQLKARQTFKRYSASGTLKFVCLLGNWTDVAPFKVRNPSPRCRSNDPFCLTDSLYACVEEYDEDDIFTAIPSVPIGRIPVLDVDVVTSALLEAPRFLDPSQAFAFGVTAECWSIPTQAIVKLFTETSTKADLVSEPNNRTLATPGVLTSPGWNEYDLRLAVNSSQIAPGAILLFNVHGSADETGWVGEGSNGYVPIMNPETIEQFNGALMITEACYGGSLGYNEPSIVEQFFVNGGKTFIGCSVIAWGTTNDYWVDDTSLSGADLIAVHFLKLLREGKSMGEALTLAKIEALQDDPLCDPVAKKTALSFNLFGAPWFSLKTSPESSVLPEREVRGSMLDRVRSRRSSSGQDESYSVAGLRRRYQSRLPENSRRFMIERNEALIRISGFQDFQKIEYLMDQWATRLEDCELELINMGEDFGFLLFGNSEKNSGPNYLFQVVIDRSGTIKKTMTTKG